MRASSVWILSVLLCACGGSSSEDSNTGGAGGSSGSGGGSGVGGGSGGSGGSSGSGAVSGTGGGGTAGGGTGGSGVGGSGGSIPLDCQELCAKNAAANCPGDPEESVCVSECQDDISAYTTACPAETDAMVACFTSTGTVSCDSSGESDIDGCDPQIVTWGGCAICVSSPSDDSCEQCQKQSCCTQMQGFIGAPDALALDECSAACTNPACQDACDAQYPAAAQAVDTLISCVAGNCPACLN